MSEHKVLGFVVAIGLCVVAGIFALIEWQSHEPDDPTDATVALVAPEADEPASEAPQDASSDAVEFDPIADDSPLKGKILVSNRPVDVLSAPSASASTIFGFPAGRPFRALGKKGEFVRIRDVRSGASGWIEEAALAPAPTKPVVSQPSSPSPTQRSASPPTRTSPPSNRSRRPETAAAPREATPQPQRRGLFGGNGILKGLFGNR